MKACCNICNIKVTIPFYTPPPCKQSFGRKKESPCLSSQVVIHPSVCQSVWAIVSSPYLSWKFFLHTKITCDLRMCHDFDPKSFGHVQDHWKEKFIICPVYTFLTEKHWKFLPHTKIAYDIGMCHNFGNIIKGVCVFFVSLLPVPLVKFIRQIVLCGYKFFYAQLLRIV